MHGSSNMKFPIDSFSVHLYFNFMTFINISHAPTLFTTYGNKDAMYSTIIRPGVFRGCKTWVPRFKVSIMANGVTRTGCAEKLLGHWKEVTGELRKLRNEEKLVEMNRP